MPPVLIQLCAHAAGYEIASARWANGDYGANFWRPGFMPHAQGERADPG